MNDSHVRKLFGMEGEAIKGSVVCECSAMSVLIVLFAFLAHFCLVICKSDPHWLFTINPDSMVHTSIQSY